LDDLPGAKFVPVMQPGDKVGTGDLQVIEERGRLINGQIGSDNTHEYKLLGKFSGQTIYEPASNGFYPEFVLKGYELRSATPAPIFRNPADTDPQRRVMPVPY
jgi:hypothetical protein